MKKKMTKKEELYIEILRYCKQLGNMHIYCLDDSFLDDIMDYYYYVLQAMQQDGYIKISIVNVNKEISKKKNNKTPLNTYTIEIQTKGLELLDPWPSNNSWHA